MKKGIVGIVSIAFVPTVVYAAGASIQSVLTDGLLFMNGMIIPLLVALAFLFFIVNVVRYFIVGGAEEEARKKARGLALWGIGAFVLIVSLWGIINLFISALNITNGNPICPDFLKGCSPGAPSGTGPAAPQPQLIPPPDTIPPIITP